MFKPPNQPDAGAIEEIGERFPSQVTLSYLIIKPDEESSDIGAPEPDSADIGAVWGPFPCSAPAEWTPGLIALAIYRTHASPEIGSDLLGLFSDEDKQLISGGGFYATLTPRATLLDYEGAWEIEAQGLPTIRCYQLREGRKTALDLLHLAVKSAGDARCFRFPKDRALPGGGISLR